MDPAQPENAQPVSFVFRVKNWWTVALDWCNHHKALLAAAVGAFFVVLREMDKKPPPSDERLRQVNDNEAVAVSIKKVAVEQGAAAAHHEVQERYRDKIEKLDADQQVQAAAMLSDPNALAEWLANIEVKK